MSQVKIKGKIKGKEVEVVFIKSSLINIELIDFGIDIQGNFRLELEQYSHKLTVTIDKVTGKATSPLVGVLPVYDLCSSSIDGEVTVYGIPSKRLNLTYDRKDARDAFIDEVKKGEK